VEKDTFHDAFPDARSFADQIGGRRPKATLERAMTAEAGLAQGKDFSVAS
jgi:hypothetical protein